MKKALSLLLAASMLALVLAGCGAPAASVGSGSPSAPAADSPKADEPQLDPANPTTITFYSYSLAFPTMRAGMEHLINNFNDTIGKEKGVIVKPVEDTTYTRFQTDIAAGEQVNVIQHVFSLLDVSRENLGLNAYEDIFPVGELKEHLSHMYPNAVKLGQIDGKTYALAFTFSTPILYINGTLFKQAGLDPNKPPKTWGEVAQYAQQIYEKTGVPGFGLSPQNGWVTEGLFFSNGADILNADKTKAVFASKEGVEAMQMWQDLYSSGAHALGTDAEVSGQFISGKCGMHLQSTALLSGIKAGAKAGGWELYGAEMPAFEGKSAIPVNSGSALAVRASSKLEAKAIWEFIKYVTGPVGYTIITSEVGYLPLNKDIVNDPQYLKSFVDENPIIRTNLGQLERLRPVTIWPAENAAETRQIFSDAVTEAVTTKGNVSDILTRAQDGINKLLK